MSKIINEKVCLILKFEVVVVREERDTYIANALKLTNEVIFVLFEYILLHLLHKSQ